jgi:hypothetical protein
MKRLRDREARPKDQPDVSHGFRPSLALITSPTTPPVIPAGCRNPAPWTVALGYSGGSRCMRPFSRRRGRGRVASLALGPGILPGRRPAVTLTGQPASGLPAETVIKAPSFNAAARSTVGAPPRRDRARRSEPGGLHTTRSRGGAAATDTAPASEPEPAGAPHGVCRPARLAPSCAADSGAGQPRP